MRTAAGYSGRPLYLIGPAHYPEYVRLLRLLLTIVVPIVGVGLGLATAVAGANPLQVLEAAISGALTVAVQIAFWVTVVFAIIDRRMPARSLTTWDVDDLPDLPQRRIGLGETVASIVGLSLLTWFLLWQPGYQATFDAGGPSIPILDPALNAFWIPYFVVVLLASIALELVTYRVGRWTVALASANTVLSLAFAVPAVWLLWTSQVLNPAFLAAVTPSELAQPGAVLAHLVAWIIAVVTALDVASSWWKALRSP